MSKQNKSIKFIKGSTDVLVIAPHGIKTKPRDDKNTDAIATEITKQLGCSALINDSIKRSKRDYNNSADAETDENFIKNFKSVLDAEGPTLVLWIHGYDKDNGPALENQLGIRDNGSLDCLIGFGQGRSNRFTAKNDTVNRLISVFSDQGISAHKAIPKPPGKNFCGHNINNMNQWCQQQKEYKNKVQSIQLEFKESKYRETPAQAKALGVKVANAIRVMSRPTDKTIVSIAFEHLKTIFQRHFHDAMVEAGQYIINTFYEGDPRAALAKNKSNEEPPNLKALINKIRQAPNATDDRAPSIGWLYNAVNLSAHEAICQQEGLQTFVKLGHSHKLQLLHVPKLKSVLTDNFEEAIRPAFEKKERLAKHAYENGLSVRAFKKYIDEQYPSKSIDLTALPSMVELRKQEPKQLVKLRDRAKKKIAQNKKLITAYSKSLKKLETILAETNHISLKNPQPKRKRKTKNS